MAYSLTELVRALERLAYEIEKSHRAGQKVTEADWFDRLHVLLKEIQKCIAKKTNLRLMRRAAFALERIRQIHPDHPFFKYPKD